MDEKTYFVVADPHGYYTIMRDALTAEGYNPINYNHVLILCGDAFDRGPENKEMFKFLCSLSSAQLIYIRGNHEDLLEEATFDLIRTHDDDMLHLAHKTNGTLDTISAFTGIPLSYFWLENKYERRQLVYNMMQPYLTWINKHTVNAAVFDHHVFTHGWLPHDDNEKELRPSAHYAASMWRAARWLNGMEQWSKDYRVPNSTVVCGHWHTSWGNSHLHCEGTEWGDTAQFTPFKDDGIIALDACTALTKKCNVLKFTENEI